MATVEMNAHPTWVSPPRRPQLSEQQKQVVLHAASEFVSAVANGRPPVIPDQTFSGASEIVLSGAFVSLKRAKHLRSCCGMLGSPISLGNALHDAAIRTAREDVRFPPISPTELPY